MKSIQIKLHYAALLCLSSMILMSYASAEEIIIQQEELSFEKCLKVIDTSENKLSVSPEIEDLSDQKRVAVFTLLDGTLTITCNGDKGNVIVSTDTN